MIPFPDPGLTLEDATNLIASGRMSCVEVVEGCLARIDEWEPRVNAWVVVDREGALNRARELDQERNHGKPPGPLHGIPIGIKDIIDVKGLPTSAGAKLWGGGRPAEADAELVANLRAAGAIILGKTVTTPYAWIDPPPTRNPWNLDRTPGGSSSGSAVAVATGMCLGAIGTQTGGSIIRPAAFCGVAGFKPSRFSISTQGIVRFALSLDSAGPFAHTIEGLRRLTCGATTYRWDFEEIDPEPPPTFGAPRCRLGRLRGPFESMADPEMTRAIDEIARRFEQAGARIEEVELPKDFGEIRGAHRIIMAAEVAVEHGRRMSELSQDYPPRISELISEGISALAPDYIRAVMLRFKFYEFMKLTGEKVDALLMPAAIGEAPDRSTTGDPVFNSPWTFLDFPAVAIPIGLSYQGLPLAVQLAEPSLSESDASRLLDTAAWCERALREESSQSPRG